MTRMTFKILFVVKASRVTRDGKTPVFLRVTVNGQRCEISISLKINPKNWNSIAERSIGESLRNKFTHGPADGKFNIASSMADFEQLMPAHIRTQKPVMHVSLNPHPDDKLSDEQLADIGREYMQRLGYGGQPYMIFKHEDIDRQHIHIVASRVQTNGKLVPDRFEKERSTKIVTDLEREYSLILPKGRHKAKHGG